MQDPNADTEWNDVLRAKGILPQKEKEISEDDVINMIEKTVQEKQQGKTMADRTLDELNDIEDEIDEEEEKIFQAYRQQRIMEMKEIQKRSVFGVVTEISKEDWVRQVNQAGEGVWVVIHVYKNSIPLCKLINQHLYELARKFPETKFLKSVSSVCIPNYPDKNLPTLFIYYEGAMTKQHVGALAFGGMNLKTDDLEWMLHEAGAVKSSMEGPPRQKIHDVMTTAVRSSTIDGEEDDDDGY